MDSCFNLLHSGRLKYRQPIHILRSSCVCTEQSCCSLAVFCFQQINQVKVAVYCASSWTWQQVTILTLRMLILVFLYLCIACVRQGLKAVSFPPGNSPNILICNQLIWHIEVLVSRVSEAAFYKENVFL